MLWARYVPIIKKNDNESMKSKKTLNLPQKGFKFVELHQTTAIYLFFALKKNETNDIWAHPG